MSTAKRFNCSWPGLMVGSSPKHVRKFIFDYFLENTAAPVLEEIMTEFHLTRPQVVRILDELETAHHVIRLPGTQRILWANPFSALDTPFEVRVGNKPYSAACAWDAVAFHIMLRQDTQVGSFCHHCAEPIKIAFSKGKGASAQPSNPLVFLSLPAAKWWDNIVLTCSNNMVFLSSQVHLDEWLRQSPGLKGEALSIEQTLKISVPLYADKMKLEYTRPTKEESMTYWNSMGLRGDFWKL